MRLGLCDRSRRVTQARWADLSADRAQIRLGVVPQVLELKIDMIVAIIPTHS